MNTVSNSSNYFKREKKKERKGRNKRKGKKERSQSGRVPGCLPLGGQDYKPISEKFNLALNFKVSSSCMNQD